MAQLKQKNWFYFALLIFVVALPFSEGLISTSIGLVLLTSLFHVQRRNFMERIKSRWIFLFISGIFLVYLTWLIFTVDWHWAYYDLQKNLSYLLIPIAFTLAPVVSLHQQRKVLLTFTLAVLVSSLITFGYFYMQKESSVLDAQQYGFIHHIRFSFQLILGMIILVYYGITEFKNISSSLRIGLGSAFLFLILFLVWHQSITGLLTFLGTAFFGVIMLAGKIHNTFIKRGILLGLLLLILLPVGYLYYAIDRFYSVDQIQYETLEKHSELGNSYMHDLQNELLENGHYVGLYLCEKELKQEWNSRADLKYGENDKYGYPVKQTLIRYLTSKDLRKDSEGVKSLSAEDISNIENGISNYILAQSGVSLYPRIYVSIWELDSYFKTGNANHRSLAQRIEYGRAALTIIKNNFWFGVGTGNWKQAYAEAYRMNKSQMDPARYGDAHNQYLNYIVKFGFVGLILILFVIIFPVIKTKSYKNPVFLLFLVSMFFANFGDSNMETHVGSNFFIFFYCLFLLPPANDIRGTVDQSIQ